MLDIRHYLSNETLHNGLTVCIRASRPDDCDRVVAAFKELDPESVYLRFFGPKKDISEAELKAFREVDFDRRVVLLCTLDRDSAEIVIASASYVQVGDGSAEIAFLVEEDYHRLGIARLMLEHLGRIATAAGIKAFVAEVLPQNASMLALFGRCGWPMKTKTEDGTTHVRLDLAKQ